MREINSFEWKHDITAPFTVMAADVLLSFMSDCIFLQNHEFFIGYFWLKEDYQLDVGPVYSKNIETQ